VRLRWLKRFLPYVSPDDIAEVFHIMTWGKGDISHNINSISYCGIK